MKKQFVLMAIAALFSTTAVFAQGGQRITPEERIKQTIEKMAPLNLNAETKAKADVIIADYINGQQKAMEEMRASGSFDRETWQVKRKEFTDARDGKLKLIFTEAQMKQWTEEIEPSLRPQRQGGGGGK